MITIAALLLMASAGCTAQDTVWVTDLGSYRRYMMSPSWPTFPDDYDTSYEGKKYLGQIGRYGFSIDFYEAQAYYMFSLDTITVYGVAAALNNETNIYDYESFPDYIDIGDTSTVNSYTWLMLYEAETDSLRQLVDTVPMYVHTRQTPQYYLQLDLWRNEYDSLRVPAVRMYERFFPTPVDVVDSFYVGFVYRERDRRLGEYARLWTYYFCADPHKDTIPQKKADYVNYTFTSNYAPDTTVIGWQYQGRLRQVHHMIFPILEPPDTTSGAGDSTLAVRPDLVYRYTNVTPNPANNKARVSSSFGITAIEAFSTSGASVYRGRFDSMVASLDVSAWPRGTYLLRITTRNGITTKKLIVQ